MLWWSRSRPDRTLTEVVTLRERLDALERKEALRAAEWADTLDKFDRLYKRLVARQDRERRSVPGQAETGTPGDAHSDAGESTLSLKRRLGRG